MEDGHAAGGTSNGEMLSLQILPELELSEVWEDVPGITVWKRFAYDVHKFTMVNKWYFQVYIL